MILLILHYILCANILIEKYIKKVQVIFLPQLNSSQSIYCIKHTYMFIANITLQKSITDMR